MKVIIKKIYKCLDKFSFLLLTICFLSLVIILSMQIVLRVFWGAPTTWAEELCRYLFSWLTFIGGGVAFSKGGHLIVDVLFSKMPPKTQYKLLFCYYGVIAFVLVYILYSGILYSQSQWLRPIYTITWITLGQVDLCIPIGSIISILYVIREMYYMINLKEEYIKLREEVLG